MLQVSKMYVDHMAKDCRAALRIIPTGTVLWQILAKESDAAPEQLIGRIVSESPFLPSKYGDEKLFFQHQRHREV